MVYRQQTALTDRPPCRFITLFPGTYTRQLRSCHDNSLTPSVVKRQASASPPSCPLSRRAPIGSLSFLVWSGLANSRRLAAKYMDNTLTMGHPAPANAPVSSSRLSCRLSRDWSQCYFAPAVFRMPSFTMPRVLLQASGPNGFKI